MSLERKLHEKIAAGLGDKRISPAILALKMTRESQHVNEEMLNYFVNYVIMMAESPLIPFHLKEVQDTCKNLKISLEELGLTGNIQRGIQPNEYLAV